MDSQDPENQILQQIYEIQELLHKKDFQNVEQLIQSLQSLINNQTISAETQWLIHHVQGSYYKEIMQWNQSLECFQKAYEIQQQAFTDKSVISSTLLSLCQIQSRIGQHHKALKYAQEAIKSIQTLPKLSLQDKKTLILCYSYESYQYQLLGMHNKALLIVKEGFNLYNKFKIKDKSIFQGLKKQFAKLDDPYSKYSNRFPSQRVRLPRINHKKRKQNTVSSETRQNYVKQNMFPITSGITRNKLLADMTDIRPVTINTKSNNTSHLSILSGRYSETSHSPVNFNQSAKYRPRKLWTQKSSVKMQDLWNSYKKPLE